MGARIFSSEEDGSVRETAGTMVAALQKVASREAGTHTARWGCGRFSRRAELGFRTTALCAGPAGTNRHPCPKDPLLWRLWLLYLFAIDSNSLHSSLALACHSTFNLGVLLVSFSIWIIKINSNEYRCLVVTRLLEAWTVITCLDVHLVILVFFPMEAYGMNDPMSRICAILHPQTWSFDLGKVYFLFYFLAYLGLFYNQKQETDLRLGQRRRNIIAFLLQSRSTSVGWNCVCVNTDALPLMSFVYAEHQKQTDGFKRYLPCCPSSWPPPNRASCSYAKWLLEYALCSKPHYYEMDAHNLLAKTYFLMWSLMQNMVYVRLFASHCPVCSLCSAEASHEAKQVWVSQCPAVS